LRRQPSLLSAFAGLPSSSLQVRVSYVEQQPEAGDLLNLGRTEVARVDLDNDLARLGVDALLLDTLATPPANDQKASWRGRDKLTEWWC
jgi:hypothetical protein